MSQIFRSPVNAPVSTAQAAADAAVQAAAASDATAKANARQAALVSGTNIKTINGNSLLGAGDLAISAGSGGATLARSARTSNTALGVSDTSTIISMTGTWTQTFSAAATLGSGWFCYLRNDGTGDITLDPNASELIDGLTSYIMYPGEVRLVQCDGVALTSIVLQTFVKIFTASDTNVRPPGYRYFSGLAWGAGGGGGGATGGGGGGGACVPFSRPTAAVPASSSVVIGAGGVAGSSGGNTTIFGVTAYGGGSGAASLGGGGGGSTSAGSATLGGGPRSAATANIYTHPFGGGDPGSTPGHGYYGGGAGSQSGSAVAGSSQYGGGGGVGYFGAGAGTSVFGGSGATNLVAATAPGGGGAYATNTAGARGEARYWGIM